MTPDAITTLAQAMLERFPVETHTPGFLHDPAVAEDQQVVALGKLSQPQAARMRQVIIDELRAYAAAQPVKLQDVVRTHACAVLARHGWNRTVAARVLGVSTKTVLNMVARWRKAGFEIPPWNGSYRRG